jgi:hypothetical protein
MLLLFQKCHDFFHGLMKVVRRGRGSEGDDGVLIMATRWVAIDDNPTAGRARPILISRPSGTNGVGSTAKFAISSSGRASWEEGLQRRGAASEAGVTEQGLGFSGVGEFGGETL